MDIGARYVLKGPLSWSEYRRNFLLGQRPVDRMLNEVPSEWSAAVISGRTTILKLGLCTLRHRVRRWWNRRTLRLCGPLYERLHTLNRCRTPYGGPHRPHFVCSFHALVDCACCLRCSTKHLRTFCSHTAFTACDSCYIEQRTIQVTSGCVGEVVNCSNGVLLGNVSRTDRWAAKWRRLRMIRHPLHERYSLGCPIDQASSLVHDASRQGRHIVREARCVLPNHMQRGPEEA